MKKALIIFVFLYSVVAVQAKEPIEIKLDHALLGKTPTVEVMVGGKPRLFYFDSGGGVSLISPALAKEIGCTPLGDMTGYNAGGVKISGPRCEDVDFSINGFKATRDMGVLDPNQFFPNSDGKLDGSIALDAFDGQTLTIDLAGNRIIVETEKSLKTRTKQLKPLTARVSREMGGASLDIFIAAQTPNGRIWMLADTGNTNKMLFTPSAQKQLGINFDDAVGEKRVKPVKINLINLGEVEMESRERVMIYDGMLNYDLLAKMILTADFRTGKIWGKLN
ncbi:MAG TPA: aspartyl protease family protein [Pyrinomonadaceae bacterium]|nr:aspartyl protease family protein [Pyrinomonadaceae bacterium]